MTKTQLPNGTETEPVSVDFEHVSEPWGEYKLEDGTTIKVRTIVQGIRRIEAEDHQQGDEPLYQVQSNTVVRTVDIPDGLRADGSGGIEPGVE